jgi:hypothetical protein
LAADLAVPKTQRPCRKCPSTALILGSPLAVTVAIDSVHMPVMTSVSCLAVSVRAPVMIDRR